MTEHYLDNSATTQVLREAADKAVFLMRSRFGNPSSLHGMGIEAKFELDDARQTVASSLGADRSEIFFTSGGTEGNNLALFGAAYAKKRLGNRIVTTAAEHPSVLNTVRQLEKDGFSVTYIKPEKNGNIEPQALLDAIDENTILVSIMHVNNETGAVFPVKSAADAIRIKKSPALLHTDMVQSYGKLSLTPKKLGADIATVSGHKVHAPKGVGALYMRKGVRLSPRVFGGSQEMPVRPGTESLPLIGAFAEATRHICGDHEAAARIMELNRYLRAELLKMPDTAIHSPDDAVPYVLGFSTGLVKAQTMLNFLSERGVYVSSGSACGKGKQSHVLESMGISKQQKDSALRVSFSHFSKKEDVDALLTGLCEGLTVLSHA